MANRLAQETSPYLLQHAANPVDWYPWGSEALERARREDKPIFLSIGYSACHWCHVMEHESFENPTIAKAMNEWFINIKVDREERPDLDHLYMSAVQALTGRGGWPMSVFLTPDLRPFYGGTYWPPQARMGMPGFDQIIAGVAQAWRDRRGEVVEHAEKLTEHVRQLSSLGRPGGQISLDLLHAAEDQFERLLDRQHGGFGGAPKFPHPMDLRLMLRAWFRGRRETTLDAVMFTLDKMAAGGIYDQLGGGFHRYAVDERWLVPHFEKMLYDNALLVPCYLEAWQITGQSDYRRVVTETLDYLLREMHSDEGGFYSTQDADSEGVEGKFYVWDPEEVIAVLGAERGATLNAVYDITPQGNFEGRSILNLPQPVSYWAQLWNRDERELREELDRSRQALLEHRAHRMWPGRDEKVLASWNGLAIEAFALAGGVLNEPRYLAAAQQAARFVLQRMRRDNGRLLHGYCQGQARFEACLDDYACLANGLVTLYMADFNPDWIAAACELCDLMLGHFADQDEGGFFYTADDHESLIARHKDVQDSSVPSGNSMAATVLVRLGKLTGRTDYLDAAHRTLTTFAHLLQSHPTAFGQMLLAADLWLGPLHELVLVPAANQSLDSLEYAKLAVALRQPFQPHALLAGGSESTTQGPLAGMFAGKAAGPEPALYVCRNFACLEPIVGEEAILQAATML